MIILQYLNNPVLLVIFLLGIGLAIGIHEAAHAWAAHKLGDSTAKDMGRMSINPLTHVDPIGTLMFLLVGFGWGRPVPVDERNLRRHSDVVWVALAGPASNLLAAIILGLFIRFQVVPAANTVFALFTFLNLSLMTFNLIPIPPLDGSKILRLFLSENAYYALEQYSLILILGLFFLLQFSAGAGNILVTIVTTIFSTITGSSLAF